MIINWFYRISLFRFLIDTTVFIFRNLNLSHWYNMKDMCTIKEERKQSWWKKGSLLSFPQSIPSIHKCLYIPMSNLISSIFWFYPRSNPSIRSSTTYYRHHLNTIDYNNIIIGWICFDSRQWKYLKQFKE